MSKLSKRGYATLEVNSLAAHRTGQIKAQFPFKAGQFTENAPAENGMLLFVNEVDGTIDLPTANTQYVWLHNSEVKNYHTHLPGDSNFAIHENTGFLPRLSKLNIGDTFTTNCVFVGALTPTRGQFAYVGTDGYARLSATPVPAAPVELVVTRVTTMPDGQVGIKFAVTRA